MRQKLIAVLVVGATAGWSSASAAEPTKQECASASESGQDLRSAGKLRSAIEMFDLCAVPSCPALVRADCNKRRDEARRATPAVAFVVRGPAGPVTTAALTVDGIPLTSQPAGSPVSLDPGEHTISVAAPGFVTLSRKLVMEEGSKPREELIVLEAAPPTGGNAVGPTSARTELAPAADGSSRRTVAFVVGGAGIAALALGGIAALVADSKYESAIGQCEGAQNGQRLCSSVGVDRGSTASTWAGVSTAAVILGGLGVVAGVTLFATAPREPRVTVGFAGTAVRLAGAW